MGETMREKLAHLFRRSNDKGIKAPASGKSAGKLTLKVPSKEDEVQVLSVRQELIENGESVFPGSYAEFLKMVEENAVPDEREEIENVTKTGVKETFFAFDENDRLIGCIDYNHDLNPLTKLIGQVGYTVRPSERREGYATQMLRLVTEYAGGNGADSLLLTVDRANKASIKTIENNGGKKLLSYPARFANKILEFKQQDPMKSRKAVVYMINIEGLGDRYHE